MGQLETLAITHHTQASQQRVEAADQLASAADADRDITASDLARLVVAQSVYGWWQQVMDLINGEDLDGGEAVMRIRHRAEQRLIHAQPVCYGDLFSQAMAQAYRQAAQEFLSATRPLADALKP
ncbi:hypothetical protein [Nonomuraea glycinis]|uniref:hypothetical protein n=1 Tax=Nonomuraea glycinis TaxID=2047744 RepID=UPI0033A0E761